MITIASPDDDDHDGDSMMMMSHVDFRLYTICYIITTDII